MLQISGAITIKCKSKVTTAELIYDVEVLSYLAPQFKIKARLQNIYGCKATGQVTAAQLCSLSSDRIKELHRFNKFAQGYCDQLVRIFDFIEAS